MLNFEGHDVPVDVDFKTPGRWIKLADIDHINDVNSAGPDNPDKVNFITTDGLFPGFILPPYSGFLYRHVEA
jgi:hypothetical protein